MKYFVISLFLISFVGFIIPQAFAAGENFFYGTTTFERLPTTIVPNSPTKFEIKFHYTAGSYALESLAPIIEVSPEGARSKVHFDVKPVSAYQNDIVRIPVTITVDPDIEYEKIFLSISYAGIGLYDASFKSSWSDSIIFNIASDADLQTIPCYDTKENRPYQCTPEESREFYIYKGKEWMEQKKLEMISFLNTGPPDDFHAWIDQSKDHSNWNVYMYYASTEGVTKYVVPESPHKQLDRGTAPQNIRCTENLILILKHDGMPACVTLETKIELTVRGWAQDDRVILGCMGERYNLCYPEDRDEYRKVLQKYYYGFNEEPNSKISVMCMPLEISKETATFFKVPSHLPDEYSFKCSFSGTPYESYMIFHNKRVPDGWTSQYSQLVSDGAIFIYQTDRKSAIGEKEFAKYGSATQRIQDTYDDVMMKNPSLQPQLIRINGMLAYAVDSCSNCGMQTANFTDGTIIQKHTSTEATIKFIDENGVSYFLKAGIPLNELVKVAESLQ